MPTTTLYLVRHAHSDWNSDENRPLSARGRQDALHVAELLRSYPIEAIYASEFPRAIQTVQPLASRLGLEIQIEPLFRERDLGEWIAPTFEDAVLRTWLKPGFAFPGGESNRLAQKRGVLGVQSILHTRAGQHVAIGTHGNLLALILNHYDPSVGYDFWFGLSLPDVYRLKIQAPGTTLWARVWE